MTIMRLRYLDNVQGGAGRVGRTMPAGGPFAAFAAEPPLRDLDRSDIIRLSGAGWGDTVLPLAAAGEPGHDADQSAWSLAKLPGRVASWGAASADAQVGSETWQAKITAFVAACVATGHWVAEESDDRVDVPGGL